MGQAPQPSNDELQDLREVLIGAVTNRVPPPDGEDVVQEALIRVVEENPRPGAPGLRARGLRKLRDAGADYYRRRKRKREPPVEALDSHADVAREDAALRVVEISDLVRSIAGPDVMQFARWRAGGMTESDMAKQPGWSAQRAHAAARKLARKTEALVKAIRESEGPR